MCGEFEYFSKKIGNEVKHRVKWEIQVRECSSREMWEETTMDANGWFRSMDFVTLYRHLIYLITVLSIAHILFHPSSPRFQ